MTIGFTFGGVHSDAFDLIVNRKHIPLMPPVQNRIETISGKDGAWDYGTSFAPREIDLDCTLFTESDAPLRSQLRKLAGVLNPKKGTQVLIFDDDPDVQYYAKIDNQIPIEQLGMMGTFTLQMVCPDPFAYGTRNRSATFSNSVTVTHNGTEDAKPSLIITHDGGEGTVENRRDDGIIQTVVFDADSEAGTYTVDSKEMTATRSGNAAYHEVSGDFISFAEGSNSLSSSSAISRVELTFRDTWL